MDKTLLTSGLSSEQKTEQKKTEDNKDIIEVICDCWYDSLNESSISYKRAMEEITDMIDRNIKKGKVT